MKSLGVNTGKSLWKTLQILTGNIADSLNKREKNGFREFKTNSSDLPNRFLGEAYLIDSLQNIHSGWFSLWCKHLDNMVKEDKRKPQHQCSVKETNLKQWRNFLFHLPSSAHFVKTTCMFFFWWPLKCVRLGILMYKYLLYQGGVLVSNWLFLELLSMHSMCLN